ncbi:MAG: neutral/alkaline non-lysosomal ceramidase N-terminal domain-containing protein [Planctomycetales bacterium]|nr:neutral/alkaline non-lysosomal ceramidase N-terminal domain-containing protein [Planctomycetales bacterium]
MAHVIPTRRLLLPISCIVVILCGCRWLGATELHPYWVGVAKVDITPSYPIRLNGFGFRREESAGVTQRIWAKGLAISDREDSPPLVLVTVDSLGIRIEMVDEVARRLAAKVHLPRDNFVVTFSHSHTTPKVNGASDTIFSSPIPPAHQTHIDQYTSELTDWLEQVALSAIENRVPSQLEWAQGRVTFAKNRRTPGGPVDHDLPVLIVRGPNQTVRAIYTTYACHCVTLSHNKISGDWAGYAQEALEREFPGAIGMVSIGCGSDSNPDSGVTGDNTAVAAEQGGAIAREVKRLLQTSVQPIEGLIQCQLNRISIPLDELPSTAALQQLAAQEGPAGYNASWQLAKLAAGEKLLDAIDYPVQTCSFGDSLAMVFLAGEVCVDYSLRLKNELDAGRLWMHSYANDFCAYIPSERLRQEGGYGGGAEIVYFALPATLRAGLEQRIVDEVHRQIPRQFAAASKVDGTQGSRPRSPAESLASLRTHSDLRVELVATEPLVVDPVAIDFGPDGRLWVVEMRDYPEGTAGKYEPGGVVKYLEDVDGDGAYDTAHTFLQGIPFPTGVSVWRDGVLICAAPDILYAEDTDGDGRADLVEKRYQGFETHNYQARINSLRYGLDNWVYAAAGLFGGEITTFRGEQADLRNRDFRLQPDDGLAEPVSGTTQQSRVRDDWGNWFGCDNGTLIRHYPLTDHYLRRNPHVTWPPGQVGVAPSNVLYPIGSLVSFALSGPPGRATAACGLDIYRDTALGNAYAGNAFTCEPVNQLVHRLILDPADSTFQGTRADDEKQSEFLASDDNWFRPVQVRTGPDGALWIVDMYRYVIEHPRWIPPATRASLNTRAGDDRGRIYRVVAQSNSRPASIRWDRLSLEALVQSLDHPNGTQRDLIQQMLVWRQDANCIPALQALTHDAKLPQGRLHALCTLDGLSAVTVEVLRACIRDSHAAVRRHAVRLSEPLLNTHPILCNDVLELADDVDAKVRLQLAYSLGRSDSDIAATTLAKLAIAHSDDPYLLAAVLSSLRKENVVLCIQTLAGQPQLSAAEVAFLQDVLLFATTGDDLANLDRVLAAIDRSPAGTVREWQLDTIATLLESLRQREKRQQLEHLQSSDLAKRLFAYAQRVVLDETATESMQERAVRVIIAATPTVALDGIVFDQVRIADLLTPRYSAAMQLAVADSLSRRADASVADILLRGWRTHSPTLRSHILNVLLTRPHWAERLLDAVAAQSVLVADIDASHAQQLHTAADVHLAKRAKEVLAITTDDDRNKAIELYKDVVVQAGKADAGRELFRRHCTVCHRLEGTGSTVGPDLAATTVRSAAEYLIDILDPNRAVEGRYRNYVVETLDGASFQGILAEETATSVTLLGQEDKRQTVLRRDLESLTTTATSLMPEGFEKQLSAGELRDLVTYLQSVRGQSR